MQFTYYGQSCFAINVSGKNILFDPFITGNALASHIDVDTIEADYILVSHGHGDHVGDLVHIAKRTGAKVIAVYEIIEWISKQGITEVRHMNLGGKVSFDFGEVKLVPSHHSSVLPDGTYGGNPTGFVVTTQEGNFYYSGDTALMMDMQLIPRFAKLDFAILPVGDNFTMGIDDVIIATDFIQCKNIIGVHFDTFGYIEIDHELSMQKCKNAGIKLTLPKIGETIIINK